MAGSLELDLAGIVSLLGIFFGMWGAEVSTALGGYVGAWSDFLGHV